MDMRPLGRSGLQVAPLAFGGNVFGWTADEATSFALLDAFVDGGFNLVDTADVYSHWVPGHVGGESEAIIGRWLKASGKRDRIVLATKVGKPMGPGLSGLSRAYIRSAVEASLRRLQTDRIDLYQSHDDDGATPLDETMSAFAELIREGKVRTIGASNFSAPRLAEALATSAQLGLPRYECLQPHYNLVERGYETELAQLCAGAGLACVPYFSLAVGFLTGKYRAGTRVDSARARGASRYLDDRGIAVLAALDAISAAHGTTQAAVALAWLLAQPTVVAPIASARTAGQLAELLPCVGLELTAEELDQLGRTSR